MRRSSTGIGILFVLNALALTPASAAEGVCQTMLDAINKAIVTPTHRFETDTQESFKKNTTSHEMIYSGGVSGIVYVLVDGKWRSTKVTAGDILKQEKENQQTEKLSCQHLRDEAVNGDAAAVYVGHEAGDGAVTMTIWISKSKGLPLRQDVETDAGGIAGKILQSTRFEYTNVHPPSGVQ